MKVYIATLPNGYFGSTGSSWKSMDVNKIASLLNYKTEVITINDLMDIEFKSTDIIVYTSSDEENIRLYLRDVMFFVSQKCRIIPSYEMLLSHENKGFQQFFRESKGINGLAGNYFFDIDDANLPMPKVLKTVSGAGSSGVFLVKNNKDMLEVEKEYFQVSKKRKVIKLQRRLKLRKNEFLIYKYRHKGFNRFVEQEFIPSLNYDYKILVFGNRYYTLKRNIKKGDFKASGSKLVEHVRPPDEVLNFARDVFIKLGNPYASLDIAQSSSGCHLLEYQGTNFSPGTLLKCTQICVFVNGKWSDIKSNNDLEENYAYALNSYIDHHYDRGHEY